VNQTKELWLFVFGTHLIKASGYTADKRYVHCVRLAVPYNKNMVASEYEQYSSFVSVSITYKARFVFLDVMFRFKRKFNRKPDCYRVLVQVCIAPMLSKSEKILI